jgi:hypothetical protein
MTTTPVSSALATDTFPIADVIAQVKRELAAAADTPTELPMELDSVDVSFSLTQVKKGGGKLELAIPVLDTSIGGGGSTESSAVSKMTIKLAPPRSDSPLMSGEETGGFGITAAIVDVMKQLSSGMSEEPMLEPRSVILDLSFGLKRNAQAKAKFSFFIVASMEGGVAHTLSNNIKIVFKIDEEP